MLTLWKRLNLYDEELKKHYMTRLVKGQLMKTKERLEVHLENLVIYVDFYQQSTGKSNITYLRYRVPVVMNDEFSLKISRRNFFHGVIRSLRKEEVLTGYDEIDEKYIVRSSDDRTARRICTRQSVSGMMIKNRHFSLKLVKDEGRFGPKVPADVKILKFMTTKLPKDPADVREMVKVFEEITEILRASGHVSHQLSKTVLYNDKI